ncbi:30S ribosomal protein S6e [Candidatus Woesearchaeota archaeon]|nr:30S ribosomal protein S6e [Candidatus Woesearchaeota archaeon]
MVEFKLVIGDPKTGKCYQKVVQEDNAGEFLRKKIGDKIKGDSFDMHGYEFEITGGADYCGFPMRRDIDGPVRKKILLVKGVGLKKVKAGVRKRKTVCGNTIHENITQVCLKVLKYGKKPLGEEKAEAAEEKPAEKTQPKEEKKAEVKEEKKEHEHKEEKKAEKKEEPKEDKKHDKQEKKEETKPAEKPKQEKAAEKKEKTETKEEKKEPKKAEHKKEEEKNK